MHAPASLFVALGLGLSANLRLALAAPTTPSPSWSLVVGSTAGINQPQGRSTVARQYEAPARLTADMAMLLSPSSSACAFKDAQLLYAGQYAVSPPLLKKDTEPASEVLLWYGPMAAAECTTAGQSDDAQVTSQKRANIHLETVLPSIETHKHLVFVAQEALDPSILKTSAKNVSWASPMLLKHVATVAESVISQQAITAEVEGWTWEQQMRALLSESSIEQQDTSASSASPLPAVIAGGASAAQAVFSFAKRNAAPAQGEDVARVTDIHTLHEHVRLLHLDAYWALLQMDDAALLSHELFLPTDSRIALVPSPDALFPSSEAGALTTPAPPANSSEPRFAQPQFSSLISSILASHQISTKRLEQDARILTAEDANPGWVTRHSGTEGGRKAAEWVLAQMQASLEFVAGAECHIHEYNKLFSPNVVCTIKSDPEAVAAAAAGKENGDEPEGLVLVSAHYDSRGTFGYIEAPGGDDDGSGTTLLLGVARVIGEYRMRFARDVHLVAHSGEEQGLVGSKYYARQLRADKTPVRLALQADMVAFHQPGEPAQLAFPNRLATDSATKYVQALAQLYTPELVVGYCTACCSDHQSYWEQGFAATWLFERNGAIADPTYHQSFDLTNRTGYDFEQLQGATKVALATLLETAQFYL
ncbi:hypothetical protein OC834_003802 [Tilletia horrida]|nr:hypothetical protein OC834_003802 [Tilletia horrida]